MPSLKGDAADIALPPSNATSLRSSDDVVNVSLSFPQETTLPFTTLNTFDYHQGGQFQGDHFESSGVGRPKPACEPVPLADTFSPSVEHSRFVLSPEPNCPATIDAPAPASHSGPAPNHGLPHAPPFTTAQSEYFMGLLKATLAQYVAPQFNDDYEKQLPKDEYGEEAGPNARVWRAYEQEAAAYDAAMIGQSRDGLDVMLVFSGLFSAVVTSFLVQVSQTLRPDYSGMTALLLHDLVVTHWQLHAGNASASNITTPSADPSTFTPDTLDVWVNGLWVVSLTSSLVVALSAVLVKQWLHRYMTLPSGTPGLRSHIRHFRFVGFEKWHVEAIIGTLPIIMLLSLGLFLIGLILFYLPLRLLLSSIIIVISTVVLVLYIASNMLPLYYPQCPYKTPLTDFVPYSIKVFMTIQMGHRMVVLVRKITIFWSKIVIACKLAYQRRSFHIVRLVMSHGMSNTSLTLEERNAGVSNTVMSSRQREARAAELNYDIISVDALHWVFHMSANPTLHSVVVHATAGLPVTVHGHAGDVWRDDEELWLKWSTLLEQVSVQDEEPRPCSVTYTCRPGSEAEMERLCRSILVLPIPPDLYDPISLMATRHLGEQFPRLQAASCIARRSFWRSPHSSTWNAVVEVTSVIHTIQHVPIHVMLWGALVRDALVMANMPTNEEILLWSNVLPVVLFDPDFLTSSEPPATAQVMTLSHAVQSSELRHDIFGFLHNTRIIRQFDSWHDFSVELRVVMSMWKLAVHRLTQANDRHKAPFYKVLHYAMSRIGPWEVPMQLQLTDFPLWLELIQSIVGSTFFADERFGTDDVENNCMQELLRHYAVMAKLDETFSFPSSRRVIDCGMRYILSGPDSVASSSSSSMPAYQTMLIMELALQRGHEEAYHIFIEYNWPKIICEAITNPRVISLGSLLKAYIMGMDLLLSGEHRAKCLDFLLQPRNLTMALVSSLLTYDDNTLPLLHALHPTHPSWTDILSTSSALRFWHHHKDDDTPPKFPFDDLFGEKILQDSRISTSVDDEVRDRLRDMRHEEYQLVDECLDEVLQKCGGL